jgi:16S rRNA (guanine(966)-N(2))-methyltransferase RsmD
MRVIAGSAKGRRLSSIAGSETRPTSSRVKEAMFGMLTSRFDLDGARILDLFAGSGSVGIEALSRGAAHVTFVERSRAALAMIRKNLAACGFAAQAELRLESADRALRQLSARGATFDGVFIDPPYRTTLAADALGRIGALLPEGAWVVVEGGVHEPLVAAVPRLKLLQSRRYGGTQVALFEVGE